MNDADANGSHFIDWLTICYFDVIVKVVCFSTRVSVCTDNKDTPKTPKLICFRRNGVPLDIITRIVKHLTL